MRYDHGSAKVALHHPALGLGKLRQMGHCRSLCRHRSRVYPRSAFKMPKMPKSAKADLGGARLAVIAMLALLGACAGDPPAGEPSFYRSLAVSGAQLDPATAASMISGYRR